MELSGVGAGAGVGTVVISGPPNGGKSTQCKRLLEKYGLVHIAAGDILRARQKDLPELARFMNKGLLVPDDLVCSIIRERLVQKDCRDKGVLLDGFPRTRKQAEVLAGLGIDISHVIVLEVPDVELFRRVEGRRIDPVSGEIYNINLAPPKDREVLRRLVVRADDTKDKMRKRLQMYHGNIKNIVNYYGSKMVRKIEADAHPDRVFDRIRDVIEGELYWGCLIRESVTVRAYECSPTFDVRGTSDFVTMTNYFEHMLWLMLGRGVLADVVHPISFRGGARLVREPEVQFVVRAHNVELHHGLVPGLELSLKVWLEHVGERSVIVGHTATTTADNIRKALKLMVITGQQRTYLEMLDEVLRSSSASPSPSEEIEIARGSTSLVAVVRGKGTATRVPHRKRLRNLVVHGLPKTGRPAFVKFSPSHLKLEPCPRDAFTIEWLVQPNNMGMDGAMNPATLVSFVESARYAASTDPGHTLEVNAVAAALRDPRVRPQALWIENVGEATLGDRVRMRMWVLQDSLAKVMSPAPSASGCMCFGFELAVLQQSPSAKGVSAGDPAGQVKRIVSRGLQVLAPAHDAASTGTTANATTITSLL
ncbi:Probable adenylate kinase 2 [Durusdinium trenchii]|uniref:Chloroplastic (Adenylate monophosphate kinase 2) n=1 Tax=Durusdinium trenchii TaxID=1381693 RepID=A0ABP0HUJ2_9DINO